MTRRATALLIALGLTGTGFMILPTSDALAVHVEGVFYDDVMKIRGGARADLVISGSGDSYSGSTNTVEGKLFLGGASYAISALAAGERHFVRDGDGSFAVFHHFRGSLTKDGQAWRVDYFFGKREGLNHDMVWVIKEDGTVLAAYLSDPSRSVEMAAAVLSSRLGYVVSLSPQLDRNLPAVPPPIEDPAVTARNRLPVAPEVTARIRLGANSTVEETDIQTPTSPVPVGAFYAARGAPDRGVYMFGTALGSFRTPLSASFDEVPPSSSSDGRLAYTSWLEPTASFSGAEQGELTYLLAVSPGTDADPNPIRFLTTNMYPRPDPGEGPFDGTFDVVIGAVLRPSIEFPLRLLFNWADHKRGPEVWVDNPDGPGGSTFLRYYSDHTTPPLAAYSFGFRPSIYVLDDVPGFHTIAQRATYTYAAFTCANGTTNCPESQKYFETRQVSTSPQYLFHTLQVGEWESGTRFARNLAFDYADRSTFVWGGCDRAGDGGANSYARLPGGCPTVTIVTANSFAVKPYTLEPWIDSTLFRWEAQGTRWVPVDVPYCEGYTYVDSGNPWRLEKVCDYYLPSDSDSTTQSRCFNNKKRCLREPGLYVEMLYLTPYGESWSPESLVGMQQFQIGVAA